MRRKFINWFTKLNNEFVSDHPHHSTTSNDEIRFCYGLNLDDSLNSSKSFFDRDGGYWDHDRDGSSSHQNTTPIQTAIQTAEIFNGIIVGQDGVILSQNERAEKRLLGTIVKGGQSRQSVKIERIIAVTDSRTSGEREGVQREQEAITSITKSQLLVVRGQFENVSSLVLNGAKMLRKNKALPHKKTALRWLPRFIFKNVIDYCSTADILNLSQSCKLMLATVTENSSIVFHKQPKKSRKSRRYSWKNSRRQSKSKLVPSKIEPGTKD